MIKISVEVRSDATRSRMVVRAKSIMRAVSIASAHYPGSEVRVLFPIDPETFFDEDPGSAATLVWLEDAGGDGGMRVAG